MSNDNPMNRRDMFGIGDYDFISDGYYVLCEDVVARIEKLLESNYSADVLEIIKKGLS